jgi:adenylylsulfate kinase
MRILIMGLPGAGKTTLATALKPALEVQGYSVVWFNADRIRQKFNDWDFSESGRIRQARRMREAADAELCDFVICDFVCPLESMKLIFEPDFVVWVDTIAKSRFDDTNKIFNSPKNYHVRVTSQDTDRWLPVILDLLVNFYKRQIAQELTHSNNDQ